MLENCPECGSAMAPTLDGPPFCPSCGYQDSFSGLPTLGPGEHDDSEEMGHTLLYDADMLGGPQLTPTKLSSVQATPRKGEPAVNTPAAGTPVAGNASRKRSASAAGLRLPRCCHCDRPLELEEVSAGICIVCQSKDEEQDDGGFSFGRMAEISIGLLAMAATIWAVILAFSRAQADQLSEPSTLVAGLVLAAFVLLVCCGFAMGGRWAAGAGFAFGLPVAGMAAFLLVTGEIERDPILWWTWLSAGVVGALVSMVALACFRVRTSETEEDPAPRPARRSRYNEHADSGGRGSAVFAGCLALGAAVFAGWFSYGFLLGFGMTDTAFSAASGEAVIAAGSVLACAALCLIWLGIWFMRRPSVLPLMSAMLAAPLAGALPAWMLAAAIGFGWNAARPLALVSGIGKMLGVASIAALPRAATPEIFAFSVSALVLSGVFSLLGIFSREPRGAALSGYGLAWSLIWTAGIIAGSA